MNANFQAASKRAIPAWAVLAVCCIAQFMVVLDVSIVNVALPKMRADLDLSPSGQQWIINAYTLTFAGFLLLGGRAADLFGRRRVFLLGLGLFTVCSLLGGLAQNGAQLIAARTVQGIGAAILAPATLSLLTTTFTEPHARRRALGAWSATAASGATAGVLAGGILTDLLDWRWVLFVNVPIGIALAAAAVVSLVESRSNVRPTLDLAGAATVTGGLALLVYGIVSTDTRPWASIATIGTLSGAAALLTAFVVIESRLVAHPLVPLAVFRLRSVTIANGVAVMLGAALFGMFFFLSLYLQQVNGYSPLKAGFAFLPAALATLTGALFAPRLVARVGVRRQLIIGPAGAAVGLAWLGQLSAGNSYFAHVFGALVIIGLGVGMSFVPMTMAATADVPLHQAGLASGLINTTRQVGGAVGLAVMATIAAGASSPTAGYDRAFWTCAAAILIAAVLALALPGPARPQPQVSSDEETAQPLVLVEA